MSFKTENIEIIDNHEGTVDIKYNGTQILKLDVDGTITYSGGLKVKENLFAGSGTITSGIPQVTISTTEVIDDSVILITPKNDAGGGSTWSWYTTNIVTGTSFDVVGVGLSTDMDFNWFIINYY